MSAIYLSQWTNRALLCPDELTPTVCSAFLSFYLASLPLPGPQPEYRITCCHPLHCYGCSDFWDDLDNFEEYRIFSSLSLPEVSATFRQCFERTIEVQCSSHHNNNVCYHHNLSALVLTMKISYYSQCLSWRQLDIIMPKSPTVFQSPYHSQLKVSLHINLLLKLTQWIEGAMQPAPQGPWAWDSRSHHVLRVFPWTQCPPSGGGDYYMADGSPLGYHQNFPKKILSLFNQRKVTSITDQPETYPWLNIHLSSPSPIYRNLLPNASESKELGNSCPTPCSVLCNKYLPSLLSRHQSLVWWAD